MGLGLVLAGGVGADTAVDQLGARLEKVAPPVAPASAAWSADYALARLQLKKAELARKQGYPDPEELAQGGLKVLDRLDRGEAVGGAPGKLTELAYVAANDGSVQPYYLYLPPDYVPGKRWPLLVFLHGYVPTTSVNDPWVLTDKELAVAGDLGAMLLIPYGRRNTDFQGVGEVDVLASLGEVTARYQVDPDRVYLTGVSMGARGVWHIAAHYPGTFAAIAPIAGHTDMARWWGWDRGKMPLFKLWVNSVDNPLDLAENLLNTPIYLQHAADDTLIPVAQSRLMVARLRELNIPVKYDEYAQGGHYIYWDPLVYRRAWDWLLRQRLNRSPREVALKAWSLDYGRAFWASTDSLAKWGQPGALDAQVGADPATVQVSVTNLETLGLNLGAAPVRAGVDLQVQVGAVTRKVLAGTPTVSWNLVSTAGAVPCWCAKRPGVCGPVAQAFRTPFLLVRGTGGTEAEKAELRAQTDRWVKEWEVFCDGRPPVVDDTAVGKAQVEGYNLVLFGTPQTNSVLAQIAGKLPVKIGDHAYEIGGHAYAGPTLGLVMCYPNPLDIRRLVVVLSGEFWGGHLGANHKFDLLPDYTIYDTASQEYDSTDQHLCAGFFNENWERREELEERTR
jgi:dienelactone hydrolase